MIFINIVLNIILPIFLVIGIGFVMDRKFKLDIRTLSRLNFYVFVPIFIFIKILGSNIQLSQVARICSFALLHAAVLCAVFVPVFSLKPFRGNKSILLMGTLFYNAGNYGIPLMMLAFGSQAVGVISVIIMCQNLLCFTFGIFMIKSGRSGFREVLKGFLDIPVIYAIGAGFAMRALHLALISQLKVPLTQISDGLIGLALLTLGVQLARNAAGMDIKAVSWGVFSRLAVSPLAAVLLVPFFAFDRTTASVLILASGLPVAVSVYILANEYENGENLTSQLIFWSTVISAATIPLLLMILRYFY
jgi:malate permease and related proteins